MQDLLNRLKWRHLKLIHAIDEQGQLSLAAARLSLSQPAASRTLGEIEAMIGQPLFIRTPKGMTPTPIAEVLIRHAASLLRGLSATVNEVTSFGAGKSGSVRVGSVTGAAVAYLVPAIKQLTAETKGADIHIDVGPSDVLMNGLQNGDFDFILSRITAEQDARGFDIMHGRVEMVQFLVRADHPLLQLKSPELKDLEGYSWVAQGAGTPMRQAVEEAFAAHSLPLPEEIVNTSSLLVMLAYLQSGDSIGPISSEVAALLVGTEAKGVRVIKLRQSIIISPYHLLRRKDHIDSPLSSRLRELVIEALSEA
jgi:DNA-binding transcriptional LysR family regulator